MTDNADGRLSCCNPSCLVSSYLHVSFPGHGTFKEIRTLEYRIFSIFLFLIKFFQAYGFFIVPQLKEVTLNNVTKSVYEVGDYGTYYLVVNQAMINAAIQTVKDMQLPKAIRLNF